MTPTGSDVYSIFNVGINTTPKGSHIHASKRSVFIRFLVNDFQNNYLRSKLDNRGLRWSVISNPL